MTVFLLSFCILLIVVVGMAIGILLGRPAIKGSCGGLNHIGLSDCNGACSAQEKQQCETRKALQRAEENI